MIEAIVYDEAGYGGTRGTPIPIQGSGPQKIYSVPWLGLDRVVSLRVPAAAEDEWRYAVYLYEARPVYAIPLTGLAEAPVVKCFYDDTPDVGDWRERAKYVQLAVVPTGIGGLMPLVPLGKLPKAEIVE